MHELYYFDFLDTVSQQLFEHLEGLSPTPLTSDTLGKLQAYQAANRVKQGVYVLFLGGKPVYVGKADDAFKRLSQHLRKLSGRLNVSLDEIGYKSILLDKSMSTAANEKILIRLFQAKYKGMWNGLGFGPNDPGKRRDTTKPGKFDREHPINLDLQVEDVNDEESIDSLLKKMTRLPFVVRYEAPPEDLGSKLVDLTGVSRDPVSLLKVVMNELPHGWRAAVLSYGIVLYPEKKKYEYANPVIDSGS